MPDISMCKNNLCPKRYSCYRFMATPSEYQYYGNFKPEHPNRDRCDYYWKNIRIKNYGEDR